MGKKTPRTGPSPWDFVTLLEEDRATVKGNMQKIGKDRARGRVVPKLSSQTDRQTHTHRHTYYNILQPLPQAKQL